MIIAAVCPSPPLLAPELTGLAEVLPDLRAACAGAVGWLLAAGPDLVAVVGAGPATAVWEPAARLEVAAYAPGLPRRGTPGLPLALGLGALLLDGAGYAGPRRLHAVGETAPAAECVGLGASLAGLAPRVALLVLGDGSARRSVAAPGHLDARAAAFDESVLRALRDGDMTALAALDAGLARELMATGRAAWQVLAGAMTGEEVPGTSTVGEIRYAGAPFGVGYLVAVLAAGHDNVYLPNDQVPEAGLSITVTGISQKQAWRDRVLPPVEKVRPGVWSVPTVFPDSPLRYVLAYLVETPRGPVLIDTGWPVDAAWDGLVAGVRETGHEVSDVTAVLVTHFHADHFGLARRVREASGAWIGMHEADVRAMTTYPSIGDYAVADRAWLTRRGVPAGEIDGLLPAPQTYSIGRAVPDLMIADGDRPLGEGSALRAIWTPGHTPGHLCFADERYDLLLTGDHVLPRISPNISPSPASTEDTLGIYLRSLTRLAESEDPDEVLPAHEYRFSGLAARVLELQEHHRARLDEVRTVVEAAPGCTTADVAALLTWSRPWDQAHGIVRRSAIGETYAHLVYLERRGLLANEVARPGGPDHWQCGPAAAQLSGTHSITT